MWLCTVVWSLLRVGGLLLSTYISERGLYWWLGYWIGSCHSCNCGCGSVSDVFASGGGGGGCVGGKNT